MLNERVKWVDNARGFEILVIFSVHFFREELGETHLLVQLLSMSALTIFYFSSGYFCNCRFDFRHWLKHHVYTLLLPYLSASLVLWFVKFIQHDAGLTDRFIGIFLQLPNTPWEGGRWFVPSFFVAKMVFDFAASRFKEKYSILCMICTGCAVIAWIYTLMDGPRLPWNIEAAFFAQPFFAMGFGWKHGLEQRYAALPNGKKAVILSVATVACLSLGAINQILGGRHIDYHSRELNELFTAYGASSCAMFLILQISLKNSRLLAFMGRNSLIYYLYGSLVAAVTSRIIIVLRLEHWAVRYFVGIVGLVLLGIPISLVLNRYFPWAVGKRKLRNMINCKS